MSCKLNILHVLPFDKIFFLVSFFFLDVSPRPISRERERRTSTRLHRGIPTSSDLQREATRMSIGQPGLPQGSIMSGLGPGPAIMASTPGGGRRGSASKEDVPRSGSSKHVRNK